MVQYSSMRFWKDVPAKERTIERLIALRGALQSEIKAKRGIGSILLASWNLRDFDNNKFGHGPRLDESYLYIAEIISSFDLVALQEINRDLRPLEKLVRFLGRRDWDYIVTDITEGRGGNQERMAFLYNKHRVTFSNMAGEIVLPGKTRRQFARTPYIASFQAGWFKFNLVTVHKYFGSGSAGKARRVEEIAELAEFVAKRQEKEVGDYIVLGDFNIVSDTDPTMKALTDKGFTTHHAITALGTTLKGANPYDQIAFRVRNKMLELGDAGVFDFEKVVFSETDHEAYRAPTGDELFADRKINAVKEKKYIDKVKGRKRRKAKKDGVAFEWSESETRDARLDYYLKEWRSFQISDHKPIWVELKVDFTTDYLNSLKPEKKPLADMDDEPES